MKGWLFAAAPVVAIWFFGVGLTSPEQEASLPVSGYISSVSEQSDPTGTERCLAVVNNELKNRSCILPRQTSVQWVHSPAKERTSRAPGKTLQQLRLKRENHLRKVCEAVSDIQTMHYSALLCRRGYYIFALRKLLI